jgi:Tfp pilus assembly PilM family ATPase
MRTIGIDPGDLAAKVVEIDGSYKKTRLVHVGIAPVAAAPSGPGDAAKHAAARGEAVVVAMGEGRRGEAALAHPCREAILRPLDLPFTGREAIRKVVKAEIEGEIQSGSVDDMIVDFHEIGPGQSGGTRLLVAAVPKAGIKSILTSLAAHKVEPESIDLDNMALWRAAHWAGAFADAAAAEANVTAVVDLGAHSVNVILVEGEHLVEMRVLRVGDGAVADEIARKNGIDVAAAREAVHACLASGADQRIEVPAALPAAPKGDAAEESQPAVPATRVVRIEHAAVEAAHTACMQRIARELTRFLTASGRGDHLRAVYVTGGASRSAAAKEMLAAVFGVEVRELDLLANLSHDLPPDQAAELGPRIAVALGMALGAMGGPSGFELRQEDLLLAKGFERVKFPLAIFCMVAVLGLFVHWNLRKAEKRTLEIQIGLEYFDKKDPKKPPQFFGMLNSLFASAWFENPQQFRLVKGGRDYVYKDLVAELLAAPVHRRLQIVRDRLREVSEQKQKESGIFEDVSIESGLAVLVRWSEMLRDAEPELGRFLVTKFDLSMKAPNRTLEFTVAFRGDDFRDRRSALQRVIDAELDRADSPFERPKRPDEGKSEDMFKDSKDSGVIGAYYRIVLHVKENFRPFGSRGGK